MSQRNSTLQPLPNITPTLRKSPRLLLKNQHLQLDPKTPEPRSRAHRFCSDPSPLSSVDESSVGKVKKNVREPKCGLRNLGKLNPGLVRSCVENSGFCIRRSPRLSSKVNVIDGFSEKEVSSRKKGKGLPCIGRMDVGFDSGKQVDGKCVIRERETGSSVRDNADEIMKKGSNNKKGEADEIAKKSNECKKGLSDAEIAKNGCNVGERTVGEIKTEKRVTHGSIWRCTDEITKEKGKGIKDLLGKESSLIGAKSCNSIGSKFENNTDGGANSGVNSRGDSGKESTRCCGAPSAAIVEVSVKDRDNEKGRKTIGIKRKRIQDGENHGWTQDQELALQRAYFAAKPTPNFWKRVAKLVPGKSAQDCFNKVHADNLTPPPPQPRSRATNRDVPSFSLSASKFLKPEGSKMGKVTSRKQKGHLAQKTVRQLLQKHYNVDQGYEADLFSVLEPTFNNPFTKSLECSVSYSTPKSGKGTTGLLKTCLDKSTSALKKPYSQLGSSNGKVFVSPPVLKPLKNKALHEKYIDQLHCREAKRRKANGKSNPKKEFNLKMEAMKVLKDALVLEANDFIHKFQHRTDSATVEYTDDDNVKEGLEEDEEDDFE